MIQVFSFYVESLSFLIQFSEYLFKCGSEQVGWDSITLFYPILYLEGFIVFMESDQSFWSLLDLFQDIQVDFFNSLIFECLMNAWCVKESRASW